MDRFTLEDIPLRNGAARYVRVAETGGRLGFITPMTRQFPREPQSRAADPHRHTYMCLARTTPPLRAPLRASADDAPLARAIDEAISRKPGPRLRHRPAPKQPAVARHMSVTGGNAPC